MLGGRSARASAEVGSVPRLPGAMIMSFDAMEDNVKILANARIGETTNTTTSLAAGA